MANPFTKSWKYLMALFGSKVDEYADPKVQIQQAIEDAQRQHQALCQQAAPGHRQPASAGDEAEPSARRHRAAAGSRPPGAVLADQATSKGDATKAAEYKQTRARRSPPSWSPPSRSVEDLKGLHDQALQAAAQAKKAVEHNAMMLQQKLAERTKLLSQLEQAKMQEQVSALAAVDVRVRRAGQHPVARRGAEKIERRYANALGAAELAQNSVQGRMLEVQQSSVQMAGHSRLEQIRASMRGDALPSGSAATPAAPASTPEATPEQPLGQ